MALSKLSIQKLRAVKAAILAEPKLYDQGVNPRHTSCETPCCIAGWAIWLDNPDPEAYARAVNGGYGACDQMAKVLGIEQWQASELFFNWPDSGGKGHAAWINPGTKKAAKDGAEHIELFIRQGGTFHPEDDPS